MSAHGNIILSSKAIIRFSDCDPFNHLNNSRYIDYFLNAREDHLTEHYQFSVYEYAKQTGYGWVVGQHEIAYLQPALTMETVIIESATFQWGEKDILVEFNMWNAERTRLKAFMWSRFFYFNLATNKSAVHSEELTLRFASSVVQGYNTNSFTERLEEIKTSLRSNA